MSVYFELGQVQEKQALPVASYVFSFKDTPTLELTKEGKVIAARGDAVPGGEYNVVADLVPEGFPDQGFRVWFSNKTNTLHKLLKATGFPQTSLQVGVDVAGQPARVVARDGSEVLLKYLRFRATIRHEKREGQDLPNIRLDRVEGAA